jgi:hypothetical protein
MPLDYTELLGVQRPLERAIQGYQIGTGLEQQKQDRAFVTEQRQQQQQAVQAQQEQARAMQADLATFSQKPNKTQQDYLDMISRNPSLATHFKSSVDVLGEKEKSVVQKQASDIFSMLQAGETDLAKAELEELKIAAENSGNTEKVRGADALLKMIEVNPEAAATTAGLQLAATMGPEQFAKLHTESEKLKFKREELAQEKELTLGEQAAKARKELQSVTTAGAEKIFDQSLKLSDRFVKSAGEFVKSRDSFARVQASAEDPSAAGDMALIFNFMKVLDPGSTVREGEFATAQNAAGMPERIRAQYNRVIDGERLTTKTRNDFVSRAGKLFDTQVKNHDKRIAEYSRLAKEFDLPISSVIIDLTDPETLEKSKAEGTTKLLDAATARQLLKEAGGDKDKARELAKEKGFEL